jgi:hypothetical protein
VVIRPGRYPPGLLASLALLAVIVAVALIGLAISGNWAKMFRVSAAAATYSIVLLALGRGGAAPSVGLFMAAGGAAGAVSGVARAAMSPTLVAASVIGAALLLAPLHWWALRTWLALREPGVTSTRGVR